jgi:hypothetical protein
LGELERGEVVSGVNPNPNPNQAEKGAAEAAAWKHAKQCFDAEEARAEEPHLT